MAKAYFICDIIGDGTFDEATGVDNSFRPAVADYPVNWSGIAAFDHDKNPSKNWMLVVVAAPEDMLAKLASSPGVTRVPFGPDQLNDTWRSIGANNVRNQASSFVRSRTGVQIQRDDPRTVREVITEVGLSIDPNFNPDGLNVSE